MTKREAEDRLVFIETTEEEKAHGLRRIARRHYTGPLELLTSELRLKRLRKELLNDEEFVDRLREMLVA